MSTENSELLARIDLLERRVAAQDQRIAALEASHARSVATLASVNESRRKKRGELLCAVTLILKHYPDHSAKQIIKVLREIGENPLDLPSIRNVNRLATEARQTLGVAVARRTRLSPSA